MAIVKGLKETSKYLRSLNRRVKKITDSGLRNMAYEIKDKLVNATPVDSGYLASRWKVSSINASEIHIRNDASYAGAVEKGSPVGEKPWPSAGEKTVQADGKIWSSQAIGGISKCLTKSFIDNLVRDNLTDKL